jgi:hypothetical protein
MTPAVVMRPIALFVGSVNHSAPSGPLVRLEASWPDGSPNSRSAPAVVIRPILPASVNHSAPSGPVTMLAGKLKALGSANVVIALAASVVARMPVDDRSAFEGAVGVCVPQPAMSAAIARPAATERRADVIGVPPLGAFPVAHASNRADAVLIHDSQGRIYQFVRARFFHRASVSARRAAISTAVRRAGPRRRLARDRVRTAAGRQPDEARQLQRIERRPHLGIVVEIDVCVPAPALPRRPIDDAAGVGRLRAARPCLDAARPPPELLARVTAGVDLPGAVEP